MRTLSLRRSASRSVFKAAIESLESRQLMSTTLVDSDAAFAALSSKSFAAGDVILLKGGTTFHGQLSLDSGAKGTAANPILISSYDPSTQKQITSDAPASARATIAAGNGDGIIAYNVGGVSIRGLNVVGSGVNTNKGSGIDFYTDNAGNTKLDGVSIDHVDVSGFHQYGIALGSGNGTSGYTNAKITYVSAHDNGQAGITTYGIYDAKATQFANQSIYVGYCTAYNNEGISGDSGPSGSGIVLSDVNGAVIEYSTAYNNGANNTAGNGPVGIWVWNANAVTIQYNESYGNKTTTNDGGGFDLDGKTTNSVMQYNYAHDNYGYGFGMFNFSDGATWNNNVIRNNVSANDRVKNAVGEVFFWTGGTAMTNAQVYGNTFVVDSASEDVMVYQTNISVSVHDNVTQIGGVAITTGVGTSASASTDSASATTTTPAAATTPTATTTPTVIATPVTTTSPTSTAPTVTPVVTTSTPVVTTPAAVTAPVLTVSTLKTNTSGKHHRHYRSRAAA